MRIPIIWLKLIKRTTGRRLKHRDCDAHTRHSLTYSGDDPIWFLFHKWFSHRQHTSKRDRFDFWFFNFVFGKSLLELDIKTVNCWFEQKIRLVSQHMARSFGGKTAQSVGLRSFNRFVSASGKVRVLNVIYFQDAVLLSNTPHTQTNRAQMGSHQINEYLCLCLAEHWFFIRRNEIANQDSRSKHFEISVGRSMKPTALICDFGAFGMSSSASLLYLSKQKIVSSYLCI